MDRRVRELYDKLYHRFTGRITDGECWKLCDGWCCDEDAELALFVGEMDYRQLRNLNHPRYFGIKDDELICKAHGKCPQRVKPLVCRLFPFLIERDDRSGALVWWRSGGCHLKSFDSDFIYKLVTTASELNLAAAKGFDITRKSSYYDREGGYWRLLTFKPVKAKARSR